MSKSPLVSIVIPVFNAATTISASLESVFAQTLQDFEIIVIDDGSTDATVSVIDEFKYPCIQCYSYPNAGPAASRNKGLRQAKGQFIAFLDADDIWYPSKLMDQVNCLKQNPLAALVYGWVDYVDAENQFICSDSHPKFSGDVYKQLLIHNFIVSGSNTMIRKTVLTSVGGFDESLLAVEDWELHTRIAVNFHLICLPQVVVRYRQSETSLSNQLVVMQHAFEQANGKIFDKAPEELAYLKSSSTTSFYLYLATRAFQGQFNISRYLLGLCYALVAFTANPKQAILIARQKLLKPVFC